MSTNSSVDLAAQPGKAQLRKSLKLWQVVVMGLAYLTPMTVFDTFGIVSGISNGHVPASYLLALAGVTVYRHQLRKAGAPVSAGRFGLYLCAKSD